MKLALRYIPNEVWVDVFCYPWITRKKLGKIVHMFRNRKFAEILQYCLHERGKRMLSCVCLDEPGLPLIPRIQLPENIKFFQCISVEHFDSRTRDFLRLISTLFISNDVNIFFGDYSEDERTVLRAIFDHLVPLLHGIQSISFSGREIPLIEQYFGPKLAQVKLLTIDCAFAFNRFNTAAIQPTINFALNWLTSEERDSAEPRLLKVFVHSENLQQFSMAFRQQFLLAKSARTFAVELLHCYINNCCATPAQTADFHLLNGMGEVLDGQLDEAGDFRIYRHKADFARSRLEEWVKQIVVEKRDSTNGIWLTRMLTMGQIDTNADEVDDVVEEEAGPSSPKKSKLA